MTTWQHKMALVTGAFSGMGKAIARQLLADGVRVFAAARRLDAMDHLTALGATTLRLDVSRDEAIRAAVDRTLAEAGGVDILVNNAGLRLYGPVGEVGLDEARHQFEVNLFGAAPLTPLLLPAMRERGAGTIVTITSMGGRIYTPLGAWYHATKHALEGWSDCLRLEVAPFGVWVVVVEPGIIRTGFGEAAGDGLAADVTLAVLVEIGRRGTGRRLAPRRVEVARPEPVPAGHRAYFGAEVRADAGRDALVLDPADLDRPFLGHNREMLDLLTPALAEEPRTLEAAGSTAEQVRAAVMERMAGGPPELRDVAADLGLSERTLQRRITEEGSSVREVLVAARRSLGQRLLADPFLPMEEAAFLLGYQDASSFYRAFRDWEGTTSGRWRDAHAGPVAARGLH